MRDLFVALTRSTISLAGSALTTASACVFLVLLGIDLAGRLHSPYLGILAYLLIPALFLLGLALIPIGIAWERRRARGGPVSSLPILDLNVARTRTIVLGFLILTAANVVLIATATYKGAVIMDSTRFCGTTCHTIMAPEYAGHARSAHASVRCVACHIGPGGTWFVRAKLSGTRQVLEAALHLYPRPIPAPVQVLRSARETCTECHQAARDLGDRRRAIGHRSDDRGSTRQETVLLMHLGGRRGDRAVGIHWHADPTIRIRYRSDPKREAIDTVELSEADGRVTTFAPKGREVESAGAGAAAGEWRVMDCVDCHNRVAHPSRSPEREVDEAMDRGLIDATLPFIRREAVRLLGQAGGAPDQARRDLAAGLRAFYGTSDPALAAARKEAIEAAGRVLGDLYDRNVFPAMKVSWGIYPDHLGHVDSPGCFRCHDDSHVSADGRVISQDCDTCHREETPS